MIIGFLGKGGSGKTTLSSGFALYLAEKGNKVLAVDADHNMDMCFNLNFKENVNYVGQALPEILSHIQSSTYGEIFNQNKDPEFTLTPKDFITDKYTQVISDNLHMMAAGPHTNDILYDKVCNHSLSAPLKIYLPFLTLKDNEYVVVDEKAGTDGVGSGVTTGFNLAVIVSEPTAYGIKSAKQIMEMLVFYKTPYIFALNKAEEGDEKLFEEMIGKKPDIIFSYKKEASRFSKDITKHYEKEFGLLKDFTKKVSDDRKQRTKEKIERNKNYSK